MTPIPALDELLERHPAPWRFNSVEGFWVDANGEWFAVEFRKHADIYTTLVNRYAEGI